MALDDPWSTAVPDWEERIVAGASLFPDLPLYQVPAKKALALFRRFRMPDMPGRPAFADLCSDWQFDLVEAIFGSFDPETRTRAINEFFVLIPKKNGKTPTSAAIMLVALILNDRPDAEFYLISASHQIANYSFRTVKGIIAADQKLSDLFHVQDHLKRITHRDTGAQLAISSADGDIVTGSKASGILIDEMHVLGAKPRAAEIMAELRGGFAARPEGFLLTITTQSKAPPVGQFKRELKRARRVRDGEERAPLLPILYEFPTDVVEKQTWRAKEMWGCVNPNLGVSVNEPYLIEEFRKAEMDGPEAMAVFASLHLNIEIGIGLGSEAWIGSQYWAPAGDKQLGDLSDILAASVVCTIGIDPGGLDDLLSLAVVGRTRTGEWLAWGKSWADRIVLERRKSIAVQLQEFEDAGDLVFVDDLDDAVAELVAICEQVRRAKLLPEEAGIGIDQAGKAAGILYDPLTEAGFEKGKDLVPIAQGYRLASIAGTVAVRLKSKRMRHGAQPIMGWAAANVKMEATKNAEIPTKAASGVAKIDPVMALFDAAELMTFHPVAGTGGAISIPEGYAVA